MVTFRVVISCLANQMSISFIKLKKGLDTYNKFYERYRDFNAEESEPFLLQLLFEMNTNTLLRNLPVIKVYSSSSFQNTKTISTGLSDLHKIVITVSTQTFQRSFPKELDYRDYKNFDRFI